MAPRYWAGQNGDVERFHGGDAKPSLTWHALLRRSHNRTVWSRDPDMNMSFFGDMQSETTLQIEQAPFEKPVHPETSASQSTFRQVTLQV